MTRGDTIMLRLCCWSLCGLIIAAIVGQAIEYAAETLGESVKVCAKSLGVR